ncbi:MAG: hypothetical protein JKY48_02915 [Flavobacteriales bacterium]|nr:hypothetical protein [Flavobacteriales bacterium]
MKSFAGCHNSHLININCVAKISKGRKGYVAMGNGDIVPIVASKKELIERILGI